MIKHKIIAAIIFYLFITIMSTATVRADETPDISVVAQGPYEVWGGNSTCQEITDYYDAPTCGYELIGQSETSSSFNGNYRYYLVATRSLIKLDAIQLNGLYITGESHDPLVTWGNVHLPWLFDSYGNLIGNIMDYAHDENIYGPPDGLTSDVGIPVGYGTSGGQFAGFVIVESVPRCGSSNGMTLTTAPVTNLCSAGSATTVSGNGPWTWACQGPNGGEDASCVANNQTIIFSTADMAGIWEGNSLESAGPWWSRGTFTIGSNGAFTATRTASDGPQEPLSGTFSITADGVVTAALFGPSFRCVMDSGKSVMVCTVTNENGVEMPVFTKKAASYALSDLAGAWESNSMATPGPYWFKGSYVIAPDGAFTATITGMDNSSTPVSGAFNITSDGIINMSSPDFSTYEQSTMRCVMDAGKTVVVCTYTHKASDNSEESVITIMIKKGPSASYSQSDPAGVWQISNLVSPYPWWGRGMINYYPDGSFTSSIYGSDGDSDIQSKSGTYVMNADGVLTFAGMPSMKCGMDAAKRIFACTNTSDSGDANLMIFTSSSGPVNGACGDSNGASLLAAPTSNLCTAGFSSAVSGSGPWTWLCQGTHGGNNATCTASVQNQPQDRMLSVTISGAGTVNSVTPGVSFSCDAGICTKSFPDSTALTLAASPSFGYLFSGWTGACTAASADCPLSMFTDREVAAVFATMPPLRIFGAPSHYFDTLPAAFACLTDNSSAILQARSLVMTGGLLLNRTVNLAFQGGFDAGFAVSQGMTVIQGGLVVSKGTLTVKNVVVR